MANYECENRISNDEIISSLEVIATTRNCSECKIRNCRWGDCNCSQITADAALALIERQKAEIERLRKEVNLVSIQFQDLQERYEEAQTEIAQWKEEANRYQRLWCIAIEDIETAKSEAIQEFAERLKNEIISETAYGCDSNQHTGYYDYQIKIGDIPEYIDNLVKEYEKVGKAVSVINGKVYERMHIDRMKKILANIK